jgi:hypothetical protein
MQNPIARLSAHWLQTIILSPREFRVKILTFTKTKTGKSGEFLILWDERQMGMLVPGLCIVHRLNIYPPMHLLVDESSLDKVSAQGQCCATYSSDPASLYTNTTTWKASCWEAVCSNTGVETAQTLVSQMSVSSDDNIRANTPQCAWGRLIRQHLPFALVKVKLSLCLIKHHTMRFYP